MIQQEYDEANTRFENNANDFNRSRSTKIEEITLFYQNKTNGLWYTEELNGTRREKEVLSTF